MRRHLASILAAFAASFATAGCSPEDHGAPPRLQPTPISRSEAKAGFSQEALNAALGRYVDESEAALDSRLSRVASFFEQRKSGARPFAQSVLGGWGKLAAVGGLATDAIRGLDTLFAADPLPFGVEPPPPAFNAYVEDCFRTQVLDPAKARRTVDDAVSGFLGDLTGIEGRLLLKLKTDIGDSHLNLPWSLPNTQGIGRAHYDSMISDVAGGALKDLGVSLGMFIVSNYVGNKLADGVAPEDASIGSKLAANLLTGIAADMALDKAANKIGYDPETALAARVAAGLDRIRGSLIDGDPATVRFYPSLSVFRRTHPDGAVRQACERADETLLRSANVGLRERLRRLRNDRYRRLWTVLTGHFFGQEAASSPLLMYTPLDPTKTSPPEEIIRWADSINAAYGGTR